VVDAALCGYEYSGLAKILNIPEHRRFARPRYPMKVLHETEVSTLYDGAYYVEMIAKANLVSIHTASSARSVAPFGGTRAALGTNPIAFGMPSSRGPVVLDMGTSAFMGTDLAYPARLGRLLPEGVAVDGEGQPTRDPERARSGALLPSAATRGLDLPLSFKHSVRLPDRHSIQTKTTDTCSSVFRPNLLIGLDDFKEQVTELIERTKATPLRLVSPKSAFRTSEHFAPGRKQCARESKSTAQCSTRLPLCRLDRHEIFRFVPRSQWVGLGGS
jgi:LDH2 family malate/lactate/ureidoglycolate dehydrogenase